MITVTIDTSNLIDPFAKKFKWIDWRNINILSAYRRWKYDRKTDEAMKIAAKELSDRIDQIISDEISKDITEIHK